MPYPGMEQGPEGETLRAPAGAASAGKVPTATGPAGADGVVPTEWTSPGSGTFDGVHNDINGRSTADAHPTSAITGLDAALAARALLAGATFTGTINGTDITITGNIIANRFANGTDADNVLLKFYPGFQGAQLRTGDDSDYAEFEAGQIFARYQFSPGVSRAIASMGWAPNFNGFAPDPFFNINHPETGDSKTYLDAKMLRLSGEMGIKWGTGTAGPGSPILPYNLGIWRNADGVVEVTNGSSTADGGSLADATLRHLTVANTLTITTVSGVLADGNIPSTIARDSEVTAALADKADLVGGKVPASQIPALALTEVNVVANQAAMLALTGIQNGDIAVRTDGAGTFILTNDAAISTLASWTLLNSPTDVVSSVNGQTGTVVLSAADVGAMATDAQLTAVAGSNPTANTVLLWSSATACAPMSITTFWQGILDDANAAGILGTSGTTACAGNDSRLSDTRTPTDNTVSTAKIQDAAVTLAKQASVATNVIMGRVSASTGVQEALTPAQARTVVGVTKVGATCPFDGAVADGTYDLYDASEPHTLISGYIVCQSGTATVTLKIGSTNITGGASISVSSTPAALTLTAANAVAEDDIVRALVASGASLVGLKIVLKGTRG